MNLRSKISIDVLWCLGAVLLPLLILCFSFDLPNLGMSAFYNLYYYDGDQILILFLIKSIIQNGWFVSNEYVGHPHINESFNLYDFPISNDYLNFLLIKLLSFFTQDPFFLLSLFFMLTFSLVAISSYIALRIIGIRSFVSFSIAIIYSFAPYHFSRGLAHLFLSNYYIVPFIILCSIWISQGKITIYKVIKGKLSFSFNNKSIIALFVIFFASLSGAYYGFYCVLLYFFSFFICALLGRNYRQSLSLFVIALFIYCATSILVNAQSILFWLENGFNDYVGGRGFKDSEIFGLKIFYLLIPISDHYISYFAKIGQYFIGDMSGEYENASSPLGFLGSIGFIFLLLYLICGSLYNGKISAMRFDRFKVCQNNKELISILSVLNLMILFYALSGGFSSILSPLVPFIRSNARLSIFISFIALIIIALFFEGFLKSFKKRVIGIFVVIILSILSIFDQIGKIGASSYKTIDLFREVDNVSSLVSKIELGDKDSKVFILPHSCFIECGSYQLALPYIVSNSTFWSFPNVIGRSDFDIQSQIVNASFDDMIRLLNHYGFNGIYIDRLRYSKKNGWQNLRVLEGKLKKYGATLYYGASVNNVYYEI